LRGRAGDPAFALGDGDLDVDVDVVVVGDVVALGVEIDVPAGSA
jgi:hypothetical protein